LDKRLGGLQSRSGHGGEEQNSQSLPGLEPAVEKRKIPIPRQESNTRTSIFQPVGENGQIVYNNQRKQKALESV
jgi:hypothetical protein